LSAERSSRRPAVLDPINRRILKALQRDPDISMADLGAEVGLSHTPCWRRVKQMEADGIIRGRALLIDPAALDLSVSVFCLVRLKSHEEEILNAFERAVARHEEIVQCYSMTGEHDYLVRVVVRDVRHYEETVKRLLLHLPGVAFVNSSFALKEVKNTTRLPVEP
jgi:Lrp/AsnC family transcriptional regulator